MGKEVQTEIRTPDGAVLPLHGPGGELNPAVAARMGEMAARLAGRKPEPETGELWEGEIPADDPKTGSDFDPGQEFLVAPDADDLVATILDDYGQDFPLLGEFTLRCVWKRTAPKDKGRPCRAQAKRVGRETLLGHFAKCDGVIILGADTVRHWKPTAHQMRALVYHELRHFDVRATDKGLSLAIRPHDDELFWADVLTFGAWHEGLTTTRQVFQQLGLPGVGASTGVDADEAEAILAEGGYG